MSEHDSGSTNVDDQNIERICPECGGKVFKDGESYMCQECDFDTDNFDELKQAGGDEFGDGSFRDQ